MRNAVVFSALLLAACGPGGTDKSPKAETPADAMSETPMSNVVLPPSIVASKSFRCKDNSVVVVDFLSDSRSANVSTARDKPMVRVEAPAEGQPMAGGGWSVKGGKADATITVTLPGTTRTLSCRSGKA